MLVGSFIFKIILRFLWREWVLFFVMCTSIGIRFCTNKKAKMRVLRVCSSMPRIWVFLSVCLSFSQSPTPPPILPTPPFLSFEVIQTKQRHSWRVLSQVLSIQTWPQSYRQDFPVVELRVTCASGHIHSPVCLWKWLPWVGGPGRVLPAFLGSSVDPVGTCGLSLVLRVQVIRKWATSAPAAFLVRYKNTLLRLSEFLRHSSVQ